MVTVNYRAPRPIYEQIADNFRRLIVSGVLAPDEQLPSVRELAQQLAINPNTIQRAYRELEAAGYSYSVPGKGNFVSAGRKADEGRKAELLEKLGELTRELGYLGVSREELIDYIRQEGHEK